MTIERLPSGSYRVSESINGKRYRATVKHKPTKYEARALIQEQIVSLQNGTPFGKAADAYILAKENVLSPSTIRGYRVILNNIKIINIILTKISLKLRLTESLRPGFRFL